MTRCKPLLSALALYLAMLTVSACAANARVAAAADLKFAFDELKPLFEKAMPQHSLELILGSSGKLHQQIDHGAPFDLFFSADVSLPKALVNSGKAVAPVTLYGLGRVVLWSTKFDASKLTLQQLPETQFRKLAIAAPEHAPYGARAKEALQHAGVWDRVQARLVFGENIAHTAQLIDTQAAELGIVALSLAMNDKLKSKGGFYLIPASYHQALEQAFVITQRGASNTAAQDFATFMRSETARQVMRRYGFVLPGEAAH